MASRTLLAAAAALSALTACVGSVTLDEVAGHYEGFLVTRPAGGGPDAHAAASAEIRKTGQASVELRLHAEGAADATITASFGARGRLDLATGGTLFPGPLHLSNTSGNCYTDAAKDELCLGGREIQFAFAAEGTKLVLDRMAPSGAPALESAQDYTIEQLMERAKTRNFDNQVELENAIQARLTARVAYLNLLPRVNAGVGLAAGSAVISPLAAAVLSLAHSIGDLLPFFLPSHWYTAQADVALAAAEHDTYLILQAGSMNIVQALGLSILRDELSLDLLGEDKLLMIQVRDEILAAEHNGAGDVQIGASDQLSVAINGLDRAMLALREALHEEKTAISQGSGFMNPDAVTLIHPIDVNPVTGPLAGALGDWQALATRRSVNLVQLDDMAVYARKARSARLFQWLDPAGDDSGSLGFGTVDYVAIGSSMIRQIHDRRDSAESKLLKMVEDAFTESGEVYHDYRLEVQASQLNQRLIDRLLMNFHSGIAFNMLDLSTALQGKAAADLAGLQDEYAFLILAAQMDFLTFTGPYAELIHIN